MKAPVWRKLVKEHLLPHVPDCQLIGAMLVFGQVDWILQALTLDTSAFSAERVAVWIVSQPLYVPGQMNSGDYGEKLRQPGTNMRWWTIEPGDEATPLRNIVRAITEQAMPFYARTRTARALAVYSEKRYPDSTNPPNIEVEAYSWALAGENARALEALDRLARAVQAMPPYQTWGRPILERSVLVREALLGGPEAVRSLLGGWRDDAIRQLKLEKVAASAHQLLSMNA